MRVSLAKVCLAAVCLFAGSRLRAENPDILFDTADLTGRAITNLLVTYQPLSWQGQSNRIITLAPHTNRTDYAGRCTIPSVVPGDYRVVLQDPRITTTFTNRVPSTNVTLYAADLFYGPAPAPVSDLRYPSAFGTNIIVWTNNGRLYIAAGGGVGQSITNGLATTNYVGSATNGVWVWTTNLVTVTSNGIYAFVTNLVTVTSNSLRVVIDGKIGTNQVGSGLSWDGSQLSATVTVPPLITFDWGPGTITGTNSSSFTAPFPGVRRNEPLVLGTPTDLGDGLVASARVLAPDMVKVTVFNPNAGAIAAGGGVGWTVTRQSAAPPRLAIGSTTGIRTNGLVAKYDMMSVTGTNLIDQSGNGRNGKLYGGASTNRFGIAFDGVDDFIAIPAMVSNYDFTVIMLVATAGTAGGWAWTENDNPIANNEVGMGAGSVASLNLTMLYGNGGGKLVGWDWGTGNFPNFGNEWHVFYFQRHDGSATWGCLDENLFRSRDVNGFTSINTSIGAIGARRTATEAAGNFWNGTNAYTIIYSGVDGFLPRSDIVAVYNQIRSEVTSRGIQLRDLTDALYPGNVWQRQGTVLSAVGGLADEKVLYTTTDCKLIANPGFIMVVDGGSGIMYAESPDGIHWTPPLGSGLTGPIITGVEEPGWMKHPNGRYYITASTPLGPSSTSLNIYQSTAPNVPNSYSLLATGIITAAAAGVGSVNNSGLTHLGGTNYMLFDTYTPTGLYGATSTNLTNWVITPNLMGRSTTDPIGGPSPQWINGKWYTWGHSSNGSEDGIYRRHSSVWNATWQRSCPSCQPTAGIGLPVFANGAGDEYAQLASASVVEDGSGRTFLFYCSNGTGETAIKVAIADMPLSRLVLTGEGAGASFP